MTGASKRCDRLETKPLPHVRLPSSQPLTPNTARSIMYDPQMVQPFRDELTTLGVTELLTPEDVTSTLAESGTTLVFVNSVCGCAAAGARPGLRLAMINEKKPDRIVTVFAGMEAAATAKAREHFAPYRPSSPQIALMKDGELVHMIQRQDIEGKEPAMVAKNLSDAYDQHC